MSDRFPLIINPTTKRIEELAAGDNINLTNNSIVGASTITASTFVGNLTGVADFALGLGDAGEIQGGTLNPERLDGYYNIGVGTANNLSNAANIESGIINPDRLDGDYDINITGIAASATALTDAANILDGFIDAARLTGTYNINITGTAFEAIGAASKVQVDLDSENVNYYLSFFSGYNSDLTPKVASLFVYNPGQNRLGVGTNLPAYNLDVIGNIRASNTGIFTNIISSNLNISGVTTSQSLNVGLFNSSGISTTASLSIGSTQVISNARQLQNISSIDEVTRLTLENSLQLEPNNFNSLNVSGVSTFAGITTVTGPNLFSKQLNVSGVATVGTLVVNGNEIGVGASFNSLYVSGISTFAGITTVTGPNLFSKQLNVSGVGTVATLNSTNGTVATLNSTNTNISGVGTVATLSSTNGTISTLNSTNTNISGVGTVATLNSTNTNVSGVGTVATLNSTNTNISGVGTVATLSSTNGTISTLNSTNGTINTLNSTNTNISGVGTVATLSSTNGTISTLNSTNGTISTLNSTNTNVSGVGTVATLSSTNGTISTLNSTNGTINTLNSTNTNISGVGTVATLSSTNGTISTLNSTNVSVSGASTFAGITTVTGPNLFSKQLNVSGVATVGTLVVNGNEIGVGASFNSLYVSGISTFVGLSTFNNDLYVNNNAYIKNNLIANTSNLTNINVSGVGTVATLSSTNGTISNLNSTNANISGVGTISTLNSTNGTITTLNSTNTNVSGVGTISTLKASSSYIGISTIDIISNTYLNVSGIGTINTVDVLNGSIDYLVSTNINSGIVTASTLSTGASGSAINITSNTISGPSEIIIDPSTVGNNTGALRIKGDLYVDGTTTTVNSTTVEIADFNIGVASTVGSNTLLDGAGIGIGSTAIRKTLTYDYNSDSLESSENFNLPSTKSYKIGGNTLLSGNQLTIENINSSGISTIQLLDAQYVDIDDLNVVDVTVSGIATLTNADVGILTASSIYGNGTNIVGIVTQIVSGIGIDLVTSQSSGKGSVKITSYKPIGKTIFVSQTGSDSNTGLAENDPKRTIKAASAIAFPGDTIKVYPGVYEEHNPIILSKNVAVEGTELRNCVVTPKYLNRDLFHVNNSCHITDLSFVGGTMTDGASVVALQPLTGVATDRYFDAARMIRMNLDFIAKESVGYLTSTDYKNPAFVIPTGNPTDCVDDIKDVMKAVIHDITRGGNFKCVGAGKSYFDNSGSLLHITGIDTNGYSVKEATIDALNYAAGIARSCVNNVSWTGNYQSTYGQIRDLTMQADAATGSNEDIGSCANVVSAIYSCVGVVTTILDQGLSVLGAGINTTFPGNSGNGTDSLIGITSAVYDNTSGQTTILAPTLSVKPGDIVEVRDLLFNCTSGGSIGTQKYPSGAYGYQFDVTEVNSDGSFIINTGISTISHNYVGGGFVVNRAISVTNASYDNITGITTITAPGAIIKVGDLVKLHDLEFSCNSGAGTTTLYPTGNLGYEFKVTEVIGGGTTFVVNTGVSTIPHTYEGGGFVFPPYSPGVGPITQGPYVRNCTNFIPGSIGMKVDGFAAEPGDTDDIGVTGTMSVDSYTQYNQGGIGVSITNGAYSQLVSIFTICDDIAIFTGSGGQCDITNSNSSFGRLGLVADGVGDATTKSIYRYTGVAVTDTPRSTNTITVSGVGSIRPYDGQVCYFGQLYYFVDTIDVTNGGSGYSAAPKVTISAPEGPNGITAQASTTIDAFGRVTSVNIVNSGTQYLNPPTITIDPPIGVGITATASTTKMQPIYYKVDSSTLPSSGISTVSLLQNLNNTVSAGTTVYFSRVSLQITSSHSFEWVGSGNDINKAKPALGGVVIPENEVVQDNGGIVVYTSTDQAGNFKIGDGVIINQATGQISGRDFTKALFTTMTPFILALSD